MHHEAFRLVDDDEVVVFIDDVERDILALWFGRHRLRHLDRDHVALCDMMSGVADRGVPDGHGTGEDQGFEPRAR